MIELFVKRPATTVMFVLVFVVLGLVSYFNLAMENTPKITFPFVTVKVIYPGAAPVEVESQIVKKIEDAVAEISQVKRIQSRAYESLAFVFIEFELGSDVNIKTMETKDKVEAIVNDFPSGAKKPVIEKFDPMSVPVMELIVSSDKFSDKELFELVDKKLKNKFSAIPGVASANLYGGRERAIRINLDPMSLKKHYVTIGEVVGAIASRNLNIPAGNLETKNNSISVRFIGEFAGIDEIKKMTIFSRDGAEVKLSDLGTIEDSARDVEREARFNGKTAVGISLMKVSDGNSVAIGNGVKKILPSIKNELPPGVELVIGADETEFIINETHSTEWSILIGIILTVIILYLFTANGRITFIASIVIPTSIISTFFLMDKYQFTINMMTLLAIATALGTLIANAIVIIENILVHLERGKDPQTAAIDGTKEITVAVLASAGTNLVVFTPLAFMSGIVGQFMKSFGLTVVFATLFSILASFTLTPMLCAMLLRKKDNSAEQRKERFFERAVNHVIKFLIHEYRIIFNLIFKHPKKTLLIVFIVFISSFMLMPYVGGEFIPSSDEDLIQVSVSMPSGTTISKTSDATRKIENIIRQSKEVESVLVNIGDGGVENAKLTVNLVPAETRAKADTVLIQEFIPKFAAVPDAEIHVIRGHGSGAGGTGDITINVYGDDYDKLIVESQIIKKTLEDTGYFRSISSTYKHPKDEITFIPNPDTIHQFGLINAQVGSTLRTTIYGDDTNIYKEKGEEYPIVVQQDKMYKKTIDDLKEVNIITKKGMLPITTLGELKKTKATPTLYRRDKHRIITIDGYLAKSTANQVRRVLDKELTQMKFNQGHGYYYAGNAETNDESQREIMKAFLLASILTYMILAAIMNSFIHPFVIGTSIITSLSGVVIMLFFMEHSINIASMMAIIMLVGLVVNNAILILDYTMMRLAEGVDIIEALWAGMEEKFRAVLMTSIAIIAGTMPQLWEAMKSKASMGSVMIGGMLASIVFTYVLIPVVFWYAERFRRWTKTKF